MRALAWLCGVAMCLSACGDDASGSDGTNPNGNVPGLGSNAGVGVSGTLGGAAGTGSGLLGTASAGAGGIGGGVTGNVPATGGAGAPMEAGSPSPATGGASGSGVDPGTIPEPPATPPTDLEPFSFFVTSLEIMRELSGSEDGFGGNLGGLSGADDICQQAADRVGFGAKTWHAFLSATDDGTGQPVHAIDRVGTGPWYDRNGRLIAQDIAGLLQERPDGDPQAVNDLPNEFGEGLMSMGDTHDVITGTNTMGQLDSTDPANTCNDWTSTTVTPSGGGGRGSSGGIRLGHAWPAGSGASWSTVHSAHSCAAGVNLVQNGGGDGSSIGSGGGWGAIYCFALTP